MTSSIFSSENLRAYRRLDAARKRFHLRLVGLLLAVLLFGYWLAATVDTALLPYSNLASSAQARAALSGTTEVILVGSSHVRAGIKPELLSSDSVNISGQGWDYSALEAVVRNNLERMPNLRLAIIELDVSPLRIDAARITGMCQALRVWGVSPKEVPCEDRKLEAGAVVSRLHSLVPRFRLTPNSIWLTITPAWTHLPQTRKPIVGHSSSSKVGTGIQHGPQRVRWLRKAFGPRYVRRNRTALVRLVDLLRGHGSRVVLIRMPHQRSFSNIVPVLWRRDLKRIIKRLRVTTEDQIPVWDYEGDALFLPSDFMDSVHLNSSGATKLSTRLDARINGHLNRPRQLLEE